MNKKGKKGVNMGVIAVVLVLVIAVAFFGLMQSGVDTPFTGGTAGGSCEVEPYISNQTVDAINRGTGVTVTNYFVKGDDASKTLVTGSSGSKFAIGDEVSILSSASNYLDVISTVTIKKCGSNDFSNEIYATDDSTIQVFNDLGNLVTDAVTGGATNQSASSTVIDMEVKLVANADQSSGDLIIVIEATNTSQVDDMILSGATKVDVPEFYSVAGAGSIAKAYKVSALIDGDSKTYNLKIVPESGETIDGTGVYVTAYSEQAYVDTDGSFKVGVEDSDGTIKYEDDFDYDFIIT